MLATEERRCEKVGWSEDSVDEIREERVVGGSGNIEGIEDRSVSRRLKKDVKKDGRNAANVWRDTLSWDVSVSTSRSRALCHAVMRDPLREP